MTFNEWYHKSAQSDLQDPIRDMYLDWKADREKLLSDRQRLVEALGLLLDSVDFTSGACSLTEMVGAVLPKMLIDKARAILAEVEEA